MTVLSMVPNETPFLPPKVTEISKETLRNFPHSKKVGNYLLGNTLGEGSFAKVKEALHIPTGERVAVKIIDKKKSREDSYVRKNLRREGKILQMIRHGNVVQLLEIMETQNSYYLVTELCRGGDLMDYISQRRKLPELEVKKYIRQIVSAVDYLHRLGILHRDLKIENLLLDEFRDIKIIDFGLSNCIKVVQTKEGPKAQEYCVTQCGSPAYAAPELLGRRKYGPQVDIWSIGVNMYAMLTGNLPFTVEPFNIKSLHNKMVNSQMNPIPDGITRECRDLIKKFLNPDPDRRIRLDDVMKHPWIANGSSNPMTRAPCPNKLKTETLDNSILKHMSENQGFRLGEIIRFVTGNVPSSATAMYHLFYRKLRKYIGNLKASGKIAADNRLLNRSQDVAVIQINNKRQSMKTAQIKVARIPHEKETPTAANDTLLEREHMTSPAKPSNEGGEKNHPQQNNEGINTRPWRRKESRLSQQKNDAEEFTDLMTVKNNIGGIQIPRAKSPVKIQPDDQAKTAVSPYIAHVAKKYMYSNRRNTLHSAIERSGNKTKESEENFASLETRKVTDTVLKDSSAEDESFRKRAFTFPGKIQRPKINLDTLIKQRIENDEVANKEVVTEVSNNNENNKTRHVQQYQAASPVKRRRNSVYREEVMVRSPPPGQKSPSPYFTSNVKRPYQRRISGVGHSQPKAGDERNVSPEPEARMSPTRQYLTRPARNNKLVRAQDNKQECAVDEQVSEISSGSTRPPSSRNTSGSVASNTGTTPLPSISPPSTSNKRHL